MDDKIGQELAGWRQAQERLDAAPDGAQPLLEGDVIHHRTEYQNLSADHMADNLSSLKDAEQRRKSEIPSTPPFHQAAKDEMEIAKDIWETARMSDEDTPRTDEPVR